MNKIKVLIVDDSALVRQFLAETLASDNMIEVMGTAIDPIFAFQKIMKDQPDVITLDVEMPRMDGLTFLNKLMNSYPIPVVMISSLTQKGCETTVRALELGAVDFISKPGKNIYGNMELIRTEIIRKVKNAARANLKIAKKQPCAEEAEELGKQQYVQPLSTTGGPSPLYTAGKALGKPKLVVIGASTGGVVAVKKVLAGIDAENVAVLVVLHMPAGFTTSFAGNLETMLRFPVLEVRNGDILKPGQIYVAPGGKNTLVQKRGAVLSVQLQECSPEDIYRPSVDKTFISLARAVGNEATAVILTGMGDDGARGMLLLRQVGAHTIAQSKETSLIFGMPRKAIEMGGVEYVEHLGKIAGRVNELLLE